MLHRIGRVRLIMILAAAVVSLAVAATALGVGPMSFQPKGTTRYAFTSVNVSSPTTTASGSFVDMAGMSVAVTVGAGKQADLFITFSAELNGCGPIYVRAIVDSTANIAAPGAALLFSHTGGSAESHGFTWSRLVDSGAHTVKIQWQDVGGCSHDFAGVRSLFVIANVH